MSYFKQIQDHVKKERRLSEMKFYIKTADFPDHLKPFAEALIDLYELKLNKDLQSIIGEHPKLNIR